MDHLENSIRLVNEKLELRKNLNAKKEVAARQFFALTLAELKEIEARFWTKFNKDKGEEDKLLDQLEGYKEKMELDYGKLRPLIE